MRYECINDEYFLYHEKECIPIGEEVGICFDYIDNNYAVLLKHGDIKTVQQYYDDTVLMFKKLDMGNITETIKVIQGKYSVGELNKIININRYIGKFYQYLIMDQK
jgi:hypothetical protein